MGMTVVDLVQIQRAQEQLDAGQWRRDKTEPEEKAPLTGLTCDICGGPKALMQAPTNRKGDVEVCHVCRLEGWRGVRCPCGAYIHRRDYISAKRKGQTQVTCGRCRAEAREYQQTESGQSKVRSPWNSRYAP